MCGVANAMFGMFVKKKFHENQEVKVKQKNKQSENLKMCFKYIDSTWSELK